MNENQATPLNAVGNRAAQRIARFINSTNGGQGDCCSILLCPDIARIINEETRLPALIAAVDKALAAWFGDRAPGEDPIYRQADAMRELRALREQMK